MKSAADTEYEVLTTEPGRQLLNQIQKHEPLTIAQMERLRKDFGPLHFEAAVRVVKARQKAAGKFADAQSLWLDPVRAEQATHQAVAAHKAKRFAGSMVADLCCGLGGDTLALARVAAGVISIDLDAANLRRLHFNLQRWNIQSPVVPTHADANWAPISQELLIHIDPDRRGADHTGRPRFQVDQYQPPIDQLLHFMKQHPGGAVKLSPGSDFETLESAANKFGLKTEMELISLYGECKEATLWFGQLAGPLPRSATALPQGDSFSGKIEKPGFIDHMTHEFETDLVEVDPALVRSGLGEAFAAHQKFKKCAADTTFFTSDIIPSVPSPWYCSFEIMKVLKPDRKAVRQAMKRLGWPTAVIKTRGRVTAQEALKWLDRHPLGDTAETLFLWTQKQASCAILARRLG